MKCQSVSSYDASSQYLGATGLAMPCGPVRLYEMNDKYFFDGNRRDQSPFPDINGTQSNVALEWLYWLESQRPAGTFKHALTLNGEQKIGPYEIKVDGYDTTNGAIFQFHGCFCHSCYCQRPSRRDKEQFKTWCSKRFHSEKIDDYVYRCATGPVTIMYQCQWNSIKKSDPGFHQEIKKLMREKICVWKQFF